MGWLMEIGHLLQRLEETCEKVSRDAEISAMKNDPTSAAFIPLRVKEIGILHFLFHTSSSYSL